MKAPNGLSEILKAYGDPRDYVGADGIMSASEAAQWEQHLGLVLVSFPAPLQLSFGRLGQMAHSMRVHPDVADDFRNALRSIFRESLWPEMKTFGGAFCVRQKRSNGGEFSTHSWGLAADFDVLNNQMGAKPRMNLGIVQIFEAAGFTWGGRWRPADGMHVQACSGF